MRVYVFTKDFKPCPWTEANGLQSLDPFTRDAYQRNSLPVKLARVALVKMSLITNKPASRNEVSDTFLNLYSSSRYSSRFGGHVWTFPTKRVSILLILDRSDFENREVATF